MAITSGFGWVSTSDVKMIVDALDRSFKTSSQLYVEVGCFRFETSRGIYEYLEEHRQDFLFFNVDRARRRAWYKKFEDKMDCGRIVFLHGDTVEMAKIIHGRFSFAFIDGCHCFDCALRDINAWAPKVIIGGQLLLHDTARRWQKDKRKQKGPHMQIAVREAVDASGLLSSFDLIDENEERYGTQTYQRR